MILPLHSPATIDQTQEMMQLPQLLKFQVYGEITIPFYFPVQSLTKEEALKYVSLILNRNNIELFEGDLYTSDGKTHPVIAPDCRVKIIEAIGEYDI
jgi:hypothetical protein